jgi:hypothetical protein
MTAERDEDLLVDVIIAFSKVPPVPGGCQRGAVLERRDSAERIDEIASDYRRGW